MNRAMRGVLTIAWLFSTVPMVRAEDAATNADAVGEAQVVEILREHNPTLQASMLQLDSAHWDVLELEKQYTPVVLLDGSATQTSTPQLLGPSVSINRVRRADAGAELRKHLIWGTDLSLRVAGSWLESQYNRSFGFIPSGKFGPGYGVLAKLALKQPLLRGRGRAVGEASLSQARVRRTSAEHARDRVASQLLRDALIAYWELWYADAALKIQEQARAVAMQQRDEAQARVDTGGLAPAELLTFETQLAAREEDVLTASTERERRELALLQQLGLIEHRSTIEIAEQELPPIVIPAPDIAQQRALAESAELHEREAAVELARVQHKTAGDQQRARLDLDSYVQTQGLGNKDVSDATAQFAKFDVVSAFVGLTYEAPLSSRAYQAERAKARIAMEVAEEQLREAKQRILNEVKTAVEQQRAGESKVRLAERTVDIAERQLAAEQARFATGSSTPLQVVQADDQARAARLRVARARADLLESVLSLQHLTGDLLARYDGLSRKE